MSADGAARSGLTGPRAGAHADARGSIGGVAVARLSIWSPLIVFFFLYSPFALRLSEAFFPPPFPARVKCIANDNHARTPPIS